MHRSGAAAVFSLIALSSSGCEELPTAATAGAAVTLTASPSPAIASPSSDTGYSWSAAFTVTLTETAGVGVTVGTVTIKVQQSSGGIVVVPASGVVEIYKFEMKATGNRLEPKSSNPIAFDVFYTLPNGGREALVTVTLNFSDDKGYSHTQTVQVGAS